MGLIVQGQDPDLNKKFQFLFNRRQRECEGLRTVMDYFTVRIDQAKEIFNNLDISEASIRDYGQRIGYFLGFCKGHDDIDLDIFLNFKKHLSKRSEYKIPTKNKYLLSARVFLKELSRQGFIQDVTLNTKCFQKTKMHQKTGLNADEVSFLCKEITQLADTPQNARLRAVFYLLAIQGLRQIEITRLDVDDIDFLSSRAFVLGKGRDDKEPIFLHKKTVDAIRDHIRINEIGSGALFTSFSNRTKGRLSTQTIQDMFTGNGLFTRLGIQNSVHGFRHYFTTEIVKKFDATTAQKFTRHKSLEMIQVYNDEVCHAEDAQKMYDQCFEGVI